MDSINYFFNGPSAYTMQDYRLSYKLEFQNRENPPLGAREVVHIDQNRIQGDLIDQSVLVIKPSEHTVDRTQSFWKAKTLTMLATSFGLLSTTLAITYASKSKESAFIIFSHAITYVVSICAFFRFWQGWSQYSNWGHDPYEKVASLRSQALDKGFRTLLTHTDTKYPYSHILTNPERKRLYLQYFENTVQQFNDNRQSWLTSKSSTAEDFCLMSPLQGEALTMASLTPEQQETLHPFSLRFVELRDQYRQVVENKCGMDTLIEIGREVAKERPSTPGERQSKEQEKQNQKVDRVANVARIGAWAYKKTALNALFDQLETVHQEAYTALTQATT
ncbi:MAG: hypothetical protein KDK71_10215 [Chlamydiia bacterium]|nr:hypothetical protein [Chlamydiia bacterium]MCP5505850.1 hypothetical protein [Chlamydiales bacterium]